MTERNNEALAGTVNSSEAASKKCFRDSFTGQSGFTTVEIIMILAVAVVLVMIFKDQVVALINDLFADILTFDASVT